MTRAHASAPQQRRDSSLRQRASPARARLRRGAARVGGKPAESYRAGSRCDRRLTQRNLAYFLERIDDPAYREGNGKTVLDNTLVVLGTEYGWNHQLPNLFHAVAGGHGHFKPGFHDQRANAIDLHNTILQPYGITAAIGRKTGVMSEGDLSGALL